MTTATASSATSITTATIAPISADRATTTLAITRAVKVVTRSASLDGAENTAPKVNHHHLIVSYPVRPSAAYLNFQKPQLPSLFLPLSLMHVCVCVYPHVWSLARRHPLFSFFSPPPPPCFLAPCLYRCCSLCKRGNLIIH